MTRPTLLKTIVKAVRVDIETRNASKHPKVRAYYNGRLAAFFFVLEELGEHGAAENLGREALL